MADNRIKDELLKALDDMPVELQQRVLSFAACAESPTFKRHADRKTAALCRHDQSRRW